MRWEVRSGGATTRGHRTARIKVKSEQNSWRSLQKIFAGRCVQRVRMRRGRCGHATRSVLPSPQRIGLPARALSSISFASSCRRPSRACTMKPINSLSPILPLPSLKPINSLSSLPSTSNRGFSMKPRRVFQVAGLPDPKVMAYAQDIKNVPKEVRA